jgi:hypothetical protein
MLMFAVSLRVHSKYLPGVSCQFAGHAMIACLSRIPSLRPRIRVLARVPVEWSASPSSLFRYRESYSTVSIELPRAGVVSPCRCNPCTFCNHIHCNKELICSMPTVPYSRGLVPGLEYGAFRSSLSRGATTVFSLS